MVWSGSGQRSMSHICHMCFARRTNTGYYAGRNQLSGSRNAESGRMRRFCDAKCLSKFYSALRRNSIKFGRHMAELREDANRTRPFSSGSFMSTHTRRGKDSELDGKTVLLLDTEVETDA